ncbi:hypothetical protein SPRG_11990 [Saprolegnia parasitica CBS 223.65]|uniref:Uncharacterized protein n=1 Tax=Saprolegnia parasitica (strain CBS 223.65) TaxID=695850 RepID=A0A067BX59_SAPPC|nr:hypothetical protein SPRG_11990 [Saprolegnia parasitica CBS 223.65]KDO22853.1 hypothetical protein SPRG_11990 [Saprolegnia parasitica CBS 223.65]|eukprot:XP_012206410.1 hypothetical protein SPRG_11990 [Saprolegnia parasitica CBS 223.65]
MVESAALEVLQSVRVREKWMTELRRRHAGHPAPIGGGDLCLLYRASTIDVIERIMTWRSRSGSPFLVHADTGGRNYLLLLVSDFDDVATQLHKSQRDPFLLGAPLETVDTTGDCRLDPAITVLRTEEGLYGRWHPPAFYTIPAPVSIKKRRPSNNSSIYDQEADVQDDLQSVLPSALMYYEQRLGGFEAEVAWIERCQTNETTTANAHWQRAAQLRQSALLHCGHEMTRLRATLADAMIARSDLEKSMHKCDTILSSIATEKKRIQHDRQARKKVLVDPIQLRKATRKRHAVIKGSRKSSMEARPTPDPDTDLPPTLKPAATLGCVTPPTSTITATALATALVTARVPNALDALVPETLTTSAVSAVRPRVVRHLPPGALPLYTLHDVAIQDRVCVLRVFLKPPQQYLPRGFVFHAVASDAPDLFLSCRLTLTQYDVLGYGATDRGLLAFSMWFCIVYDRRQRRFRLVWSGPSCPRPLRCRDTDATAVCIHKQGVRWERRYVLVQLFHRTDSPTTLHCVFVHMGRSHEVVDETASELGPSLLHTIEYDSVGDLKWQHRPPMPRHDHRRRVYTGSVVGETLHVYTTSNATYCVVRDATGESYTLLAEDFNPLQTMAPPLSDFGIFFDSVATFDHGKIVVNRRRWWAYLFKYVQRLAVGRFGATISGILCLVQLSLLQSKSEFQSWFHFRVLRLDNGATSELLVPVAQWLTCALAVQLFTPDCASSVCPNCIAASPVPLDQSVLDMGVPQSPNDAPAIAIDDGPVCSEPIDEEDVQEPSCEEPTDLVYCEACLDLIQTVVVDSSSARVCCRRHDPPARTLVCISDSLDDTTRTAIVARLETLNCTSHGAVTEFVSTDDDTHSTVVLCAPADVGMTFASLLARVGNWTGMVVAVVPRYIARDSKEGDDRKDADLYAQIKDIDAAIDDVRSASPVPPETVGFDMYLTSEALVMEAALACCRTSTQRTYKVPPSVVGASSWPFAARFLSEPSSLFTEMSLDIDWLTLPSTLASVLLAFYRHEVWRTIDSSLLKPPFKVLFKALNMGMCWLQTVQARGGLLTELTSQHPRLRIVRL